MNRTILLWFITLHFVVLHSGALVTGFFGIDEMKKGADRFTAAENDFHKTISLTHWQVDD